MLSCTRQGYDNVICGWELVTLYMSFTRFHPYNLARFDVLQLPVLGVQVVHNLDGFPQCFGDGTACHGTSERRNARWKL